MRAVRSQGVWDFLWETSQMAYTTADLVAKYTAANLGKAPDQATTLAIDNYASGTTTGVYSDSQALANTLKLVNGTTAVAVETYQFFTGKAPTQAGLTYLVNSTDNTTDLNDAAYAKFSTENRFINFSINLAVFGEASTSFAAAYGGSSVTYAQVVATAYDKIIGNSVATAAGVDVAAAVAYLSRQANIDYLTAFVKANGITDATKVDLAVKAALIGEILNAAQTSGLGAYASATAALLVDLSDGTLSSDAAGGVDIFAAYPVAPVAGSTIKLTAGIDTGSAFVGTANNDTFVGNTDAGALAFTSLDTIDGGAGTDSLNISVIGAVDTTAVVGASVKNIEKVTITSTGAVTADTTSWTGVTSLTSSSIGNSTVTAATTTDITATVASPTTGATINGGKAVTLALSDSAAADVSTGNTISIGATTAATGAVTVTQSETIAASANTAASALTGGSITVNGGTTVSVTNTASVGAGDNAGDVLTLGQVTVNGKGTVTSVSVTQSAATAAWATAGDKYKITTGAVVITDNDTATKSDTITSVSLTNYGASTFKGNALTTLNLTGGSSATSASGTFAISQSASVTTSAPTALTVNASGNIGKITDTNDQYTSLNIVSAKAATIADLDFTSVKTVAISGAAVTTISALTDLSSATSITSTGAGVTITPTLGNSVAFSGGDGVETISVGATTKAINLGAGNDVAIVTVASLGAGGSLNGGDGTDVLVANLNGSSFSADPAFGGFETLRVAGAAAQGSHNANGFAALELGTVAGAVTFTNVAVNTGLTILASPGFGTTVTLANATGTSDSFNLALTSSGAITGGTVTLAGIETLNIASNDTNTTAHVNTLTVDAAAAKTIVVTGNAGLTLTNTTATGVTSFDASAVTGSGSNITYTSQNTTIGEVVSIKGGAGADVLTGTSTAADTIVGGAGADTLVYTGGLDTFTGGTGADTFDLNAIGTKTAFVTITDASATDKIDLVGVTTVTSTQAAIGAKVTLGAAATFDQYLDQAAAGDGTTGAGALVKWFQFDGNTYVVVDNGAGAAFVSGTDSLIKLVGTVDLSTATLGTEVITLA
jgi:S-layer protein